MDSTYRRLFHGTMGPRYPNSATTWNTTQLETWSKSKLWHNWSISMIKLLLREIADTCEMVGHGIVFHLLLLRLHSDSWSLINPKIAFGVFCFEAPVVLALAMNPEDSRGETLIHSLFYLIRSYMQFCCCFMCLPLQTSWPLFILSLSLLSFFCYLLTPSSWLSPIWFFKTFFFLS